jgi:nucleotidyltransferase/DNA polymerase involved in DNA repair
MERLLALWLPTLSAESDDGAVTRTHAALLEDLTLFCPFTEVVRYGLFVLPVRGPSRFVGGEHIVLSSVRSIAARHCDGPAQIGVADGLFAAYAAARRECVVSAGATSDFRAALPIEELGLDALAVTARRLGIHTVGDFAALSRARVAERFAKDVVVMHDVARGDRDVWATLRDPVLFRRLREIHGEEEVAVGQMGFFGDRTDADRRAIAVAHRIVTRLGVEAVWTASTRGGRTPSDRVQWRPWGAPAPGRVTSLAPWPGCLPTPSPSVVLQHPVRIDVLTAEGDEVRVEGRGLLQGRVAAVRFRPGAHHPVAFSAGPWPHDEGWWSTRRRRAHLHVVLEDGRAFWLYAERGQWWLAGVFD